MIYSSNIVPHGTFIITLICKDGILIISDSRASFTRGQGKSEQVYAYYDNDQKIFTIGKFKISFCGINMFNKKFIHQIIEEFNKTHKPLNSIEGTFNEFHKFLISNIKVTDSVIFNENQYLLAGYENSNPVTLAFTSGDKIRDSRIGGQIYTGEDFIGYLKKPANLELTCKNMVTLLEPAIYQYAKDKNNFKIGGPLNIIQIKPDNTFLEIKSFKDIKFKSYEEMATAIINNKVKMIYLYPFSKELTIKTLTDGIKLGY